MMGRKGLGEEKKGRMGRKRNNGEGEEKEKERERDYYKYYYLSCFAIKKYYV